MNRKSPMLTSVLAVAAAMAGGAGPAFRINSSDSHKGNHFAFAGTGVPYHHRHGMSQKKARLMRRRIGQFPTRY